MYPEIAKTSSPIKMYIFTLVHKLSLYAYATENPRELQK